MTNEYEIPNDVPEGMPEECQYCYFCSEPLRWVPQVNPETKELDDIMICNPCDQAFMWKPGTNQLGVMPFDSKMQLITVKCTTCPTVVHHKQKMVNLVNEMMIFLPYCPECAMTQMRKDFPVEFKDVKDDASPFNLAESHSMFMHQKVLTNPKLMKKAMAQPRYKKLFKEMGLDNKGMARNINKVKR